MLQKHLGHQALQPSCQNTSQTSKQNMTGICNNLSTTLRPFLDMIKASNEIPKPGILLLRKCQVQYI